MEAFWKKLSQFALAFIVVLLAVVFALQFGGPQAQGCGSGGASIIGSVHGTTLTEGDYRAAYALAGFDGYPEDVAAAQDFERLVLDGLVERELLARAAEEAGFQISEDEVMRKLARDGTVYLTLAIDAPRTMPSGEIPVPVRNRDGEFDLDAAKRYIQYGLRRSVAEFGEWQVREMLAERMRALVTSSVAVSPEEVWDSFRRERDTATIKYARFAPTYYRESSAPTEEDVRAWMAESENAEAVDRDYEGNVHRYRGLEKQVRSQHILIEAESSASDEVKAAARARATALLTRARAGEDFATLARENSEDDDSARRGGDLGFIPRGRREPAFDEALFSMEVGQISDVVEGPFGFHIIKVIGIREGDVPEDEAKLEIAERLYREGRAEGLARTAAEEALAALRGGTSLDALDARLAGRPETPEGQAPPEGETEEEPRDALAPRVEEARAFGRADSPVSGLSDNGPIVRTAFELSMDSPIAEEVVRAGSDFFVVVLTERNTVTREDLTAEISERIRTGLLNAKRREALAVYVARLRRDADEEGAIRIDRAALDEDEEAPEGEDEPEEEREEREEREEPAPGEGEP